MKYFLLYIFLFLAYQNYAQNLHISVYDAETKEPIVLASILLTKNADTLQFTTDSDGRAAKSLPAGTYQYAVQMVGYKPYTSEIGIKEGSHQDVTINLEQSFICVDPVIISPDYQRFVQISGRTQLGRDAILNAPAMFFDPARFAATTVGVVQTNDGINGLSIHGLHPELLRWRMDGLEVVNPNHLPNAGTFNDRPAGGSGGVFMISSQALGESSLYAGSMPAGVGDAIAGVMDLNLRSGDNTNRKTTFQAGLLGLDAAIEGPFRKNKSSYLINYRYSTVGLLSSLGVSFGDEQIRFQDLNVHLNFPLRKGNAIRFFMLGGQSRNQFDGNPDGNDDVLRDYAEIDFKSITGIMGARSLWKLGSRNSLELGSAISAQENDRFEGQYFGASERMFTEQNNHFKWSNNATFRHSFGRFRSKGQLGAGVLSSFITLREISNTSADIDQRTLTLQPFVFVNGRGISIGPILAPKWQYDLGLHGLYERGLGEFVAQPRLQLKYEDGAMSYFGGSGMYAQAPNLNTYGSIYQPDLRDALRLMKSNTHHLGASWSRYRFYERTMKASIFYSRLSDISLGRQTSTDFGNILEAFKPTEIFAYGSGRSYGLDLSSRWVAFERWSVSGNLSLFRTELRNIDDDDWVRTRYDAGYVSNILASRSWKKMQKSGRLRTRTVSGRFVLTGGQNLTPIDLQQSILDGDTRFNNSSYSTDQTGSYHRLDIRFARALKRSLKVTTHFAIEIQNVYNRKNLDYRYFEPLTATIRDKTQLGMIPNLNWKIEF